MVMAVVLAGCTSFAPVYGTSAAGGIASARFNFLPPGSRIEQLIIDRLKVAFPGEASPQDPTLDIAASVGSYPGSISDAFDVARPANVRVTASVTIARDDAVLFAATRFSDTAYQNGKLTPVDIASSAGAQETAARNAAEAIRAAILSGYRPGVTASVR